MRLPNKVPQTILRAIVDHWVMHQGYPERLLSDRDASFISRDLCHMGDREGHDNVMEPPGQWRGGNHVRKVNKL